MKRLLSSHSILLCLLTLGLLATGCQTNESQSSGELPEPLTLQEPELFIDFDQNGLSQPAYIDLLPDKRLAILDLNLFEVLVFSEDGTFDMRFGGEGKGPGEFVLPRHFSVNSASIDVVDFELRRIGRFDREGNFQDNVHFEANPHDGTVIMGNNERYFAPAMGENNSLLMAVDTENDSSRYFGEALGEPLDFADLEEQRQILAGGEIPPMFNNEVTLYKEGNHLYVYLNAYSRVQKYTADGELLWETSVDLPVRDAIFQQTVERAGQGGEGAVPVLQYLTDFKVFDGEAYLFWNPVDDFERKLVKIGPQGEINAIYHIPEEEPKYNNFTVDPETGTLYLSAIQHGQIYRATLPDQ